MSKGTHSDSHIPIIRPFCCPEAVCTPAICGKKLNFIVISPYLMIFVTFLSFFIDVPGFNGINISLLFKSLLNTRYHQLELIIVLYTAYSVKIQNIYNHNKWI